MPATVPASISRTFGPYTAPGLPPPRRVRVHLPRRAGGTSGRAACEASGARPTLVLFDGQNALGDPGSFAGGWHADATVDRLAGSRTTLAPVVVAIDHGGEGRIRELSPWPVNGGPGDADRFLDWMVGWLLPRITKEVGLATGPANTVIGGSSMGGLAALYAHFRYPDVFGGALSMSPSFWIADQRILEYVASRPNPAVSRIYLDCGTREGRGMMLPIVAAMARHLGERGWEPKSLRFRADPRGAHSERHWRRRLPGALRFLFAR